jgi:NTE family protein
MRKALVMAGGGSVGTAWHTGLLAGWARHGLRLADADLVVGTSAGAGSGVLVALDQDLEPQRARYAGARARHAEGGATAVLEFDERQARVVDELYADGHARGRSDVAVRRRIADAAADIGPEQPFVDTFRWLRSEPWPASYVCTALDIDTAEFTALSRDHGGTLDRGLAAAVAVPGVYPAVTIGGHRYVDGGCLSVTFLDLAAGYDRILFVHQTEPPEAEWAAVSSADLRSVRPEEPLGEDLMDAAGAFRALDAGLAQGERGAAGIAEFWLSPG